MQTRDNLMYEARSVRPDADIECSKKRANFSVARSPDDVESAWRLVYERYLMAGFIDPNQYGLHCPHALHDQTCVVSGRIDERVMATMTMLGDGHAGLSLDSVYARELAALRMDGRRLLEVGLLVADSTANAGSDLQTLFELMKWGVYYALHLQINDIVVGVHPHHARFYTRCFGFEQSGPERHYPRVRNKQVVLLRLRVNEKLALQVLPRGLRHVRDNPIAQGAFLERYKLAERNSGSALIESYMDAFREPEPVAVAKPRYEAPLPWCFGAPAAI